MTNYHLHLLYMDHILKLIQNNIKQLDPNSSTTQSTHQTVQKNLSMTNPDLFTNNNQFVENQGFNNSMNSRTNMKAGNAKIMIDNANHVLKNRVNPQRLSTGERESNLLVPDSIERSYGRNDQNTSFNDRISDPSEEARI